MRETRSEYAANETQARAVIQSQARRMAQESTREEWRAILAKRDASRELRAARRERATRYAQSGAAHVLALLVGAIGSAIARHLGA